MESFPCNKTISFFPFRYLKKERERERGQARSPKTFLCCSPLRLMSYFLSGRVVPPPGHLQLLLLLAAVGFPCNDLLMKDKRPLPVGRLEAQNPGCVCLSVCPAPSFHQPLILG